MNLQRACHYSSARTLTALALKLLDQTRERLQVFNQLAYPINRIMAASGIALGKALDVVNVAIHLIGHAGLLLHRHGDLMAGIGDPL